MFHFMAFGMSCMLCVEVVVVGVILNKTKQAQATLHLYGWLVSDRHAGLTWQGW